MATIGLDARMVGPAPSGLGTYAAHLARALAARGRSHSFVVIRRPDRPAPIAIGPNVEEVVLPGDLDTPRNLVRGREISRLGLDLYHSLHHFLPPGLRVPRVVMTVHDLIWIEHRRLIIDGRFGAVARTATHAFARAAMGYAMRRADRLIAVSAYSRSRALAYYRLDPSRIVSVPHGVDHEAFSASVESNDPVRPPYFVCLGNTRPYKNIPTAMKAFALCVRERPGVELVIAGRGDSFRSLKTLARRLDVAGRVRFAGPLSHAEMLGLLHGAQALIFPSLVEGFGLPVLEAMSAGCPVIASRVPAIVEVAEDAALFCHPARPEEFAAAMTRLLDEARLGRDLRVRGHARASQFSWDRCAEGTLAVYHALLDDDRAPRRSS